jgi:DNA helicase-2/ATP-dependent DNA helicase PcrA
VPSRFISELPKDHVAREAQNGLFRSSPRTTSGFSGGTTRYPSRPMRVADHSVIDVEYEEVTPFRKNTRVFHQKFGYGTVMGVDGQKLEVAFDQSDVKKIMADFLVAEDEAGA